MPDTLSPTERSRRMSLVRGKDTGAEMIVRRLVHSMGFRYRLHGKGLPGKPDLVFRRRRKAIWVHGCFWHQHPDPTCKLARMPKSRLEFWRPKLEGNRERDMRNRDSLHAQGWKSLTIWECELGDRIALEHRLLKFLGRP